MDVPDFNIYSWRCSFCDDNAPVVIQCNLPITPLYPKLYVPFAPGFAACQRHAAEHRGKPYNELEQLAFPIHLARALEK